MENYIIDAENEILDMIENNKNPYLFTEYITEIIYNENSNELTHSNSNQREITIQDLIDQKRSLARKIEEPIISGKVNQTTDDLGDICIPSNLFKLEKDAKEIAIFANEKDEIAYNELLKKIPLICDFEKFPITLNRMIIEKNMRNSEIISRANMNKGYFYEILRGEKIPSKEKTIILSIGMCANLQETNTLLMKLGYVLSAKNKRDLIISYGIEHKFDLYSIEELLDRFKEPGLDSKVN